MGVKAASREEQHYNSDVNKIHHKPVIVFACNGRLPPA
jgi:hypothetical protein